MKNRDIKGGQGPSAASDEATEKLAKIWKPKSLQAAAQERKISLVKTNWFRGADERERKSFIRGFDAAIKAIKDAAYGNRRVSERIKEWKGRCGAE